jgi:hypothetical protein
MRGKQRIEMSLFPPLTLTLSLRERECFLKISSNQVKR